MPIRHFNKLRMEQSRFPTILNSRRLTLRRYALRDASPLAKLIEANRDALVQNFPDLAKRVSNRLQARQYIANSLILCATRRAFCYGVWLRRSKQLIGQLRVKNISWNIPSAELSYFIARTVRRRGFATEAICTVLTFAFEELDFSRVFLRAIASNTSSIRLARKLKFMHEGLHRREFRCGFDNLHDVHYFAMTHEDYRKQRGYKAAFRRQMPK